MSRRVCALAAVGVMVVFIAAAGLAQDRPPTKPKATTQPTSRPTERRRGQRRRGPVTDQAVLEVYKTRMPTHYDRLMELKDEDPNRYAFFLERAKEWYKDWRRLPAVAQDADITFQLMGIRIWEIAGKLREKPDEQAVRELTRELTDAVTKQVDAECIVLEHRLKLLEDDLARMRSRLTERRENRDKMISDSVQRWLRASTQPARGGRRGSRPDRQDSAPRRGEASPRDDQPPRGGDAPSPPDH